MTLIKPLSGRLLVRQLRDGAAIIGVLRFGPDFVPVETALYPACWVDGQIRIGDQVVQGPVEGEERYASACSWLQQPMWCRSTDPSQFTVRFVQSFPAANQWTVVALAPGDLGLTCDDSGHAWADIVAGTTWPIAPPAPARGEALGGLLGEPVWPLEGQLYTTPKLPSWQRPYFVRHHDLLARVGRDEMTIEEAKAVIRQDPELFNLVAGSIDMDYCRFLAAHPHAATLETFGPITAGAHAQSEACADLIVRGIMAETRIAELRGLAAALAA